jgi:hypothetical protein
MELTTPLIDSVAMLGLNGRLEEVQLAASVMEFWLMLASK